MKIADIIHGTLFDSVRLAVYPKWSPVSKDLFRVTLCQFSLNRAEVRLRTCRREGRSLLFRIILQENDVEIYNTLSEPTFRHISYSDPNLFDEVARSIRGKLWDLE